MDRLTRSGACLAVSLALFGQEVSTSTLQGTIQDSHGKPVAAGKVVLKNGNQTLSGESNSEGAYHFSALQPGSYTLHAGTGDSEADFGPFTMGPQENKKVDLKLVPTAKPQFFDKPSFIVAGVTDASDRGGHGSDVILHSSEALAKATASLGAVPPANAPEADALAAVRGYQHAAELDPSESHLFDWGSELLTHRAAEQATEVFSQGNRLFPQSTRMLLGLAAAWYARGSYEQAERLFFEAADLNPRDPAPYRFLGRTLNSPIGHSDGFTERMERFARFYPDNAEANYYFAMSVNQPARTEALLRKAVRLDPGLEAAWLQLGILCADRRDFPGAIAALTKALPTSPPQTQIEAHYRLAQAYRHTGDAAKARREIDLYQQLSKQSATQEELDRAKIQEFVFSLRDHQ